MILPGRVAVARGIIKHLRDAKLQTQPCGVDLSLKHVLRWTSPGAVDFDNRLRSNAETQSVPFEKNPARIHLARGEYLVQFNETVDMPLDIMGQVFARSSLWRSGALLTAGVMDCGFCGPVGGLLQVVNPGGITLYENARLAQMVYHQGEFTEGYSGVYQGQSGLRVRSSGDPL